MLHQHALGNGECKCKYTRWTTGVVTHVDVELIGVYVVQTDEWDRAQIFLDRIL